MSEADRLDMMRVLSGVLHLGNVAFEALDADGADGSKLSDSEGVGASASCLSELWGVESARMQRELTTRRHESRRGSTYSIGLTAAKAAQTRDALAKAVYHKLFVWLAHETNSRLITQATAPASLHWIGLLDAFGFELLESNSFEQLLINATNEELQQFFLSCVMNAEQSLYESERIRWEPIAYESNASTIALLHDKSSGVLRLLDEETRLPKGRDEHMASRVQASLQEAGHEQSHLASKRAKKAGGGHESSARRERTQRTIKALFSRGTPHFTVNHFAGSVCYEVVGWLDKNADVLFPGLHLLMRSASRPLIASLFDPAAPHNQAAADGADAVGAEAPTAEGDSNGPSSPPALVGAASPGRRLGGGSGGSGGGGGGGGGGGVVSAPTICTRFTQELSLLMRELRSSTVHFVRCLKPNETLTPNAPDHAMLLDQLLFSGMLEACKVMRATFPGRIPFDEVYRRFQGKLPVSIMRMAPSEFIRAVVVAIDIPQGARTGRSVPCRPTYTLVLRRAGGVEGGAERAVMYHSGSVVASTQRPTTRDAGRHSLTTTPDRWPLPQGTSRLARRASSSARAGGTSCASCSMPTPMSSSSYSRIRWCAGGLSTVVSLRSSLACVTGRWRVLGARPCSWSTSMRSRSHSGSNTEGCASSSSVCSIGTSSLCGLGWSRRWPSRRCSSSHVREASSPRTE